MTVLITLTTAGADSGPFNLYTNLDGYVTAFATGVSKSALLAGYSSAAVPNFTTTIRVKSNGDCVNYIDIVLTGLTTTTTTTAPLGCTAYTIYNGAGADEPYSYTACGGDFVGTFIGGFSSDGPFCAVTGSLVIGGSISITLEEPCSAPATTTTTSTTVAFSNELSLHLGLCADVFFPDYTYYVSQTIPNVVLQDGDIAYFEPGFINPIDGLGQTFTGFFNSIKYQFVINNVGVISSVIAC